MLLIVLNQSLFCVLGFLPRMGIVESSLPLGDSFEVLDNEAIVLCAVHGGTHYVAPNQARQLLGNLYPHIDAARPESTMQVSG